MESAKSIAMLLVNLALLQITPQHAAVVSLDFTLIIMYVNLAHKVAVLVKMLRLAVLAMMV